MLFHKKKSNTILGAVLIGTIFGIIGFCFLVYHWVQSVSPADIIQTNFVQQEIKKRVGEENAPLVDLIPALLGFQEEKTYLLLFLNNTELRPGGGFIGSYAVIKVNNGNIELVTLEGSEQLDRRTPESWKPTPPQPLTDHLGVSQWYFRDANWDPDFESNVDRVLEFYTKEGGVSATDIDIVAAVDTQVIQTILALIGPVSVQNKTFTAENVIELLQYDTSYGYQDRGVNFENRKQILDDLFIAISKKIPGSVLKNYAEYVTEINTLITEKHIQLYSTNKEEQQVFRKRNIAGTIDTVDHDYVLWVDANLAALKTDHAINRTLSYKTKKAEDGGYIATASMTYVHSGVFDWRTSRYRTYARVYVPKGSTLVSTAGSMLTDKTTVPGIVDQGTFQDKQWFGTFISIEPGKTGTLSFTYQLPSTVIFSPYKLLIEKQAGLSELGLVVELGFNTPVQDAVPAEEQQYWGDTVFQYSDQIRTDQLFTIEY